MRVTRVLVYDGPEDWIRATFAKSIHGTYEVGPGRFITEEEVFMTVPTIGRKVWFRPAGGLEEDQPLDATVCFVHEPVSPGDDYLLNIAYHDKYGHPAAAQRIPLFQGAEHEKPWGENFCEWMPYQQAQAAKEAASKEVGQQALAAAVASDKVAALLKS